MTIETDHASGQLVVVGIPTYNRVEGLRRAVESILAQTHQAFRIVISDNASTDETESYARALARRDSRVLYRRHESNVGPVDNFNSLLEGLRGDYFMFLADDDWLDVDYLECCVAVLRSDSGYALVAGRARFHPEGSTATAAVGLSVRLEDDSPADRVRSYHREVDDNSVFYGVMPTQLVPTVVRLPPSFGGDHLFVSAAAALGKVRTIDETSLHRSLGGTSADTKGLARALGVSSAMPWVSLALNLFKDIAWESNAYGELCPRARVVLALQCQRATLRRLLWAGVFRIGRTRAVRPVYHVGKRWYLRSPRARSERRLRFPGHATLASHKYRVRGSGADEPADRT